MIPNNNSNTSSWMPVPQQVSHTNNPDMPKSMYHPEMSRPSREIPPSSGEMMAHQYGQPVLPPTQRSHPLLPPNGQYPLHPPPPFNYQQQQQQHYEMMMMHRLPDGSVQVRHHLQQQHQLPFQHPPFPRHYPPHSAFHRPIMQPEYYDHRSTSQMSFMTLDSRQEMMRVDSRSPSPPSIPPPPKLKVPFSAPAKIHVPVATRVDVNSGPLRENSRRLNVLQQQQLDNDDLRDDAGDNRAKCHEDLRDNLEITAAEAKDKPIVSMHDASLLLGLRTSDKASPGNKPEAPSSSNSSLIQSSDQPNPTVGARDPPSDQKTPPKSTKLYELPAPVPSNYPKRLTTPGDEIKLNQLHCYVRSHLLEVFVVEPTKEQGSKTPNSSVGRVGLRCVYCAQAWQRGDDRSQEAPMAVCYPKNIAEIYRLVTSWQRCHLRKCNNVPPAIRSDWEMLRSKEKTRGKTHHWVESAKQIGLVDCSSKGGGICFYYE